MRLLGINTMKFNVKKTLENKLILALGFGASVEQTACQYSVSERTIYRRLQDPVFRQRVADIRSDLLQRACGMMSGSALEACKTLVGLMGSSNAATVRLQAARAI